MIAPKPSNKGSERGGVECALRANTNRLVRLIAFLAFLSLLLWVDTAENSELRKRRYTLFALSQLAVLLSKLSNELLRTCVMTMVVFPLRSWTNCHLRHAKLVLEIMTRDCIGEHHYKRNHRQVVIGKIVI